jgi:hypothetical protein
MDKKLLIIVFMLLPCLRGEVDSIDGQVISITESSHPGILFEHVYDLRFITEYWQITCYLDTAWEKYQLSDLEEQIDELKIAYGHVHRETFPRFETIEQKFNETYGNFRQIDNEMRYLNGTLAPETLWHYWPRVNYTTKDERVLLMEHNNKMLLESSVTERTPMDRQMWRDLHQSISATRESIKSNNPRMHVLHNTLRVLEDHLDQYIARSRLILQTIETLKGNKMCDAILDHEDLLYVKNRIEAVGVGTFAFNDETITMRNVLQLSKIEFGVAKRRISINIIVPIVRPQRTRVYEMQALPAPQAFGQILYIKPEKEYTLVNNNGYYYFSRSELKRCKKVDEKIVCESEWFVYREETSCEFNLFINPEGESYENCNIVYKQGNSSIFARAISGNRWVFVTFGKVNITTYCKGERNEKTIESTGIIELKNDCVVQYRNNNLTLEKHSNTAAKKEIVIPKKNLQLEKLTPLFNNDENSQKLMKLLNQGKHEKEFWEIERLVQQSIAQNATQNNIYVGPAVLTGILVVLLLIVVGILTFLYYSKNNSAVFRFS